MSAGTEPSTGPGPCGADGGPVLHIRPRPDSLATLRDIRAARDHRLADCGVTITAIRPAGTYEVHTWGTNGIQAAYVREIADYHGWEVVQELSYQEWEAQR